MKDPRRGLLGEGLVAGVKVVDVAGENDRMGVAFALHP